MRADLTELPSPHPIAHTLPGLYQGHAFTELFCSALDDVIAPVVSTLDNLPAYLDVGTAPADLLPWLAHWIGMPGDQSVGSRPHRELLQTAARLQGWQGTRRGIELAVAAVLGLRCAVQDSGGADWSWDADTPMPGQARRSMEVVVFRPPARAVDERHLEALVTSLKPAHVAHRVEVRSED
jgi:phage tail-like protein